MITNSGLGAKIRNEMKGLTLEQYVEIVNFVQEHHAFGRWIDVEDRKYPMYNIKYIDNCYDSRDRKIWSISFRGLGVDYCFHTNHFVMRSIPKGWKYDNLYDLCMAFLKGEFEPKDEFRIKGE